MRLYTLALTRRIDDEEEANGRGGKWSRRKKRPTVEEYGATKQWSRLLLGDGRPIGYVLAPVGDQYRGGSGRRQLPRRPVGLVTLLLVSIMVATMGYLIMAGGAHIACQYGKTQWCERYWPF